MISFSIFPNNRLHPVVSLPPYFIRKSMCVALLVRCCFCGREQRHAKVVKSNQIADIIQKEKVKHYMKKDMERKRVRILCVERGWKSGSAADMDGKVRVITNREPWERKKYYFFRPSWLSASFIHWPRSIIIQLRSRIRKQQQKKIFEGFLKNSHGLHAVKS